MPSSLHAIIAPGLVLLFAGHVAGAQSSQDRADVQTRRLPPSAFPRLPTTVRTDLERRGCTIPQAWIDTKPGNVISGHFRNDRQLDWAVLCSLKRVSTILVYWAGRADSADQLASAADKDFLQGVGGDSVGFSRSIDVVQARFIREHFEQYGGSEPPPIDHEGINDAFVEKASVVRYWYQGKWLALTGAD
ncbi:MAG TPA: hypothetical protein VNA31_07275 [bacterium]|nr:hypothetical protein [bacterium]